MTSSVDSFGIKYNVRSLFYFCQNLVLHNYRMKFVFDSAETNYPVGICISSVFKISEWKRKCNSDKTLVRKIKFVILKKGTDQMDVIPSGRMLPLSGGWSMKGHTLQCHSATCQASHYITTYTLMYCMRQIVAILFYSASFPHSPVKVIRLKKA